MKVIPQLVELQRSGSPQVRSAPARTPPWFCANRSWEMWGLYSEACVSIKAAPWFLELAPSLSTAENMFWSVSDGQPLPCVRACNLMRAFPALGKRHLFLHP